MDQPDFKRARQYALERLERELPPTLIYHSLAHTRDDVVPAAERLAALPVGSGRKAEDILQAEPLLPAALLTLLQDAQPAGQPTAGQDSQVEVTLEVPTAHLWHLLFECQRRQRLPARQGRVRR